MKFFLIIIVSILIFSGCGNEQPLNVSPTASFVESNLDEITSHFAKNSKSVVLVYSSISCMDCVKMTLQLLETHLQDPYFLFTLSNEHDHGFIKANLSENANYEPLNLQLPNHIQEVTLMVFENSKLKHIILPNLADKNKTSNEIHEALQTINSADSF